MYKIEKGVEIPERGHGPGRTSIYPWADMGDGDSTVVPVYSRNAASGWLQRNRPGWKAITRTEGDGMIRVWFVDRNGK